MVWDLRRAVDVPIAQATAASSSRIGSVPTKPALPALAYPLQVRVLIPRDKTSCKSANAALELVEVSSNWGGTHDPGASPGLHGLMARFINKGKEECCPPTWSVVTESGTFLQSPVGAWDVPMDIQCGKPGADSWAGTAVVHIGFTTPVGTRKVQVRVALGGQKSALVTIHLETGETSLRYDKQGP